MVGNIIYLATIAGHLEVGYLSRKYLMSAYGGLAVLWLGAVLCYPFMCGGDVGHDAFWQELIRSQSAAAPALAHRAVQLA